MPKKQIMTGMGATKIQPANKIMLGFIVRRCAADLGHTPTPDEFAAWANGNARNGHSHCLFGKAISPAAAKVMLSQPGRLVTISPGGLVRIRGKRD